MILIPVKLFILCSILRALLKIKTFWFWAILYTFANLSMRLMIQEPLLRASIFSGIGLVLAYLLFRLLDQLEGSGLYWLALGLGLIPLVFIF